MTQEDKKLLLKDLSGRLPYEVFCVGTTYELDDDGERYIPVEVKDTLTEIHNYKLETAFVRLGLVSSCKLETVKPYLRSMSSMTPEEYQDWIKYSKADYDCEFKPEPTFSSEGCHLSIDWLNANHFDYRGLILRGLAIEAPDEMYQ